MPSPNDVAVVVDFLKLLRGRPDVLISIEGRRRHADGTEIWWAAICDDGIPGIDISESGNTPYAACAAAMKKLAELEKT